MYKHRKQMCIPQTSEVPECLVCSAQFVRIHARNKHYREVHSVDVNDLACRQGEKDSVLMKLISKRNPFSLIKPSLDESSSGELMNTIKCSPESIKISDISLMKIVADEIDVMSQYKSSEEEVEDYFNSPFNHENDFSESLKKNLMK